MTLTELRAEYERLAASPTTRPAEWLAIAGRLEQMRAPSPDYARALLDRARDARACAERSRRNR